MTRKLRSKKTTGAPLKNIDWEIVDKKLMAGCNGVQIAACLGVHPDTLYLRCEADKKTTFTAYSQEKRAHGDSLIHDKQYEKALQEGNTTMLIWLGKQRLGQSETLESNQVDKEAINKFNQLLDQISSLRSLRNSSETGNKTLTSS